MNHIEDEHQKAVFQWAALMQGRWPELRFMYHCPNGGSRNKIEAIHLKAQGVKAGVPDIFLPSARHGYHGLYIEMKAGKNKPTATQLEYLEYLTEAGYLCEVCYDSTAAIKMITKYLTLNKSVDNKETAQSLGVQWLDVYSIEGEAN